MKPKPFIILISLLLLLIALSTGCTTKKKLHSVTSTESTVSGSKDASMQVATSDVLAVQESSTATTLQTDLSAQITEEFDTDKPTDKSTGTPPLKTRITAIKSTNAQVIINQTVTTLSKKDSTAQAQTTSKADSTGRAASDIDQQSTSKPPNLWTVAFFIFTAAITIFYTYATSHKWIPTVLGWITRAKNLFQ